MSIPVFEGDYDGRPYRIGFKNLNPFFMTDGYKTGHHLMYPEGTEEVLTNGTPRSNKHAPDGIEEYVAIGMQPAIQKLHAMFEEGFFKREIIQDRIDEYIEISAGEVADIFEQVREEVISDIETRYSNYLGTNFNAQHIRELWDLGYLPIEVKILPEGTLCPMGVPFITIRNTNKNFAWITNFLETPISAMLWKIGTAASIAFLYKTILLQAAVDTDEDNLEFVNFQAHNFSMRGMDGIESASNVSLGHGAVFKGDDTLTSLVDIEHYYDTKEPATFSVNATEHSVMCAGGDENELETFRFLMKQFPTGPLSIVSDTWDLWDVCTRILPELKEEILERDGKIIIRPDSGNPVDIICGGQYAVSAGYTKDSPQVKGVIELLWDVFGGTTNAQGYKVLDPHIGAIYGDSITPERATRIVNKLEKKGFASTNIVLGVGSYTYQMNTRDTFGFAMKATNVVVNGISKAIFKDPITDDGRKKSARGRLVVANISGLCNTNELLYDGTDNIVLMDEATEEEANTQGLLYTMYKDGTFIKRTNYDTIRDRIDMQIESVIDFAPIIPDNYEVDVDKLPF